MAGETHGIIMLVPKIIIVSASLWCLHGCFWNANPRWRVWLWRIGSVVLVGLIFTALSMPLIELPNRLIFVEPEILRGPKAEVAPMFVDAIDSPNPVRSELATIAPASQNNFVMSPRIETEAVPATFSTAAFSVFNCLAIFWLTGVLVFLGKRILEQRRIARVLAQADRTSARVMEIADGLAEYFGLKRVEVVSTRSVRSPSVTGLCRNTILLPHSMLERSNVTDIRAALTHELAHVHGRDLLWDAWIDAVSILLWPNVLGWKMRAAHRDACEKLCDAVSSQHVGKDEYQKSLARIALKVLHVDRTLGMTMAKSPDVVVRLRFLQKSISTGSLGIRGVVGGLAFVVASGFLGVVGFDNSSVINASAGDVSHSPLSAESRDKAPIDFHSEIQPDPNVLFVADKPPERELNGRFPADDLELEPKAKTRPEPQSNLERQLLITFNGKKLHGLLPPRPDFESSRKIQELGTWQLANGEQLQGRLWRVGRQYVSIKVGDQENDVLKTDLAEHDRRRVRKFEQLQREQQAWEVLRKEKARDAMLKVQLPSFRRRFEAREHPKVIPCTWKVKREAFGYVRGTVLVTCDFDFEQLTAGTYVFQFHSISKRRRERGHIRPIGLASAGFEPRWSFTINSDLQLVDETTTNSGLNRLTQQRAELRGNSVHVEAEVQVRDAPHYCLVTLDENALNRRSRLNRNVKLPLPTPTNATEMTFEQFIGEQDATQE